jgi:hypothetical protein
MGYLDNLLRQSGVNVGPRPAAAGPPTAQLATLDTDVTRVVTPAHAPDHVPAAAGEQAVAPPAIAGAPAAARDPYEPPPSERRHASHDEVASSEPVRELDPERIEVVAAPLVLEQAAEGSREAPPAPQQIVLEHVAWVAAGSEPAEEPAPASDRTVVAAPAPFEAEPVQAARPATPPAHREPGPDVHDLTVSVGTIELTVEEPPGPAVASDQARPGSPAPAAPQGRAPALTRHYVRV